MLFQDRVEYKYGGEEFGLPRMFKARQIFPGGRIENITGEVRDQIASLPLPDLTGKNVALTAGSRGIANIAKILRAAADFLKEKGAAPFIVPAMGSHAGATAESQKDFIAGYGITEAAMGVPIISSMEVVRIGETASGFPVYCDAHAASADYILPVNRIKPHTNFKAEIESGTCKMLVIGLGKHKGASAIHAMPFSRFSTVIQDTAKVHFATGKVFGSLGIVENAYDDTMRIEGIPVDRIIEREKELLAEAKRVMAKFLVDSIDVLIVEEIGKNISGGGMDANVIGRATAGEPGFETIPIQNILVLGIAELSHGNALGVGVADIVTVDFMKQLDIGSTYTNAITSHAIRGARLPMAANSDREAVKLGVFCSYGVNPADVKIVQIINTILLSEVRLSEAYLPLVKDDPRFEILSDPEPMRFDGAERLERLPRPH